MSNNLSEITIMIKTFEREQCLVNILKSIKEQGIFTKILIADDSKYPYQDNIIRTFPELDIEYHVLPFDSGLSYGRNYLLKRIQTPYFLLCDDDFYFDKRTNLEKALRILINNNIDILSGSIYNYIKVKDLKTKVAWWIQSHLGKGFLQTFVAEIKIENACLKSKIKTRVKDHLVYADMVHNFFLAKTKKITQLGGWDADLKMSEHGEFFIRAKEMGLTVAHSGSWGVRHYPIILHNYAQYRKRDYDIYAFNKMGLEKWIDEIDNGSTFIRIKAGGEVLIRRTYHRSVRGIIRKIYNIHKLNEYKISRMHQDNSDTPVTEGTNDAPDPK